MTPPPSVAGERADVIAVPGAAGRARAYRTIFSVFLALAVTGVVLVYYWHRHPPAVRTAGRDRSGRGSETEMRLPKLTLPGPAETPAPAAVPSSAGVPPAASSVSSTVPLPAPPPALPSWNASPGTTGAGLTTGAIDARVPVRRAVSPVLLREVPALPAPPATTPPVEERGAVLPVKVLRAAALPQRRFLLPRGSFLDCTLETAVDSTLPGLATCIVATDQYGADGTVVLLARGSRLVGETHSDVRTGQARVAITWTEARTPDGVVLPLGAGATDGLGRAGVPGTVDRHTVERFGAAVMLSVIDAAATALANRHSTGTGVVYNVQGSRDVATEALRQSIHIPPTILVEPGARVSVTVVADVDFSEVYTLVHHDGE